MGRFGSDPHGFFDSVYGVGAPWDIGGPQPDMVALLAEFPPRDPVLDVGCGGGDLSVHLGGLGYQVTGIDFVQAAIDQARRKRAALPPDIAKLLTFKVGDAARPAALGVTFGSVVDSGFLHVLDPAASDAFVEQLAETLIPGGRLYLHEFAVEFPHPNMPRAISESEVRSRFSAARGWQILGVRQGQFHSSVAPPVAAILACIERAPA